MMLPEQGQQNNYLVGIFREGYKRCWRGTKGIYSGVHLHRYFMILTIKYDNLLDLLGISNDRHEVNFQFAPEYLVAAFGPDDIA